MMTTRFLGEDHESRWGTEKKGQLVRVDAGVFSHSSLTSLGQEDFALRKRSLSVFFSSSLSDSSFA